LNVALDKNNQAKGDLFIDDGESLDSVPEKKYTYIEYNSNNNKLFGTIKTNGYNVNDLRLNEIKIYGVNIRVCKIQINGRQHLSFSYEGTSKTLSIINFNLEMSSNFEFI